MDFAEFAARAEEIEDEPTDHGTVESVAELFRDAEADLPIVARFVQGRIVPAHDGTKLDIGPNLCYAALAKSAGENVSADDIESRLAAVGEIGAVAEALDLGGQQGLAAFGSGGDQNLTIENVDGELRSLAAAEGSGSTDTKLNTLFGLFNRTEPLEARFLSRLVLGEMRIGVGERTVRDSIAEAFDVPVPAVARALQVSNDCGLVAERARERGERGLSGIELSIGRPIKPMLAQAGTAVDAVESWDEAGVETKFDGARVQIHHDGETTRLFSRNLEDVTEPLPEIVETVAASVDVPAIVDGEVVAIGADGSPLPFQNVLRRFRRKHDIAAARDDIGVELRVFDCVHADGEDLLDTPFSTRHEHLTELFEGTGCISRLTVTDDPAVIAELEANALNAGHEGIMLKNPDSTYTPGDRGKNWLKRKPDVETLDLVVTGAEWGEGRRANLLGTFLLSVRDGDSYETIGKVATGITDEKLEELHERLEPYVRSEAGTVVETEPVIVFEVGYEEIQQSPTYSSGYALRFPRFIGVREDKDPDDADSLERVERLIE
jgi:DNA ligase-1